MAVIARVAAKMRGNTEQAPASGTKSPKYGSSIAMKVVSPQYSLHMPNLITSTAVPRGVRGCPVDFIHFARGDDAISEK